MNISDYAIIHKSWNGMALHQSGFTAACALLSASLVRLVERLGAARATSQFGLYVFKRCERIATFGAFGRAVSQFVEQIADERLQFTG